MVIERSFAVFFGLFNLLGPEVTNNIDTRIIVTVTNATFIQFCIRIQLIVTTGRTTDSIDALMKTVMAAGGSIFHLQHFRI